MPPFMQQPNSSIEKTLRHGFQRLEKHFHPPQSVIKFWVKDTPRCTNIATLPVKKSHYYVSHMLSPYTFPTLEERALTSLHTAHVGAGIQEKNQASLIFQATFDEAFCQWQYKKRWIIEAIHHSFCSEYVRHWILSFNAKWLKLDRFFSHKERIGYLAVSWCDLHRVRLVRKRQVINSASLTFPYPSIFNFLGHQACTLFLSLSQMALFVFLSSFNYNYTYKGITNRGAGKFIAMECYARNLQKKIPNIFLHALVHLACRKSCDIARFNLSIKHFLNET